MGDPVGPRMLSFALTFLLLLLFHNPPANSSIAIDPECEIAETELGNLRQTREKVLLKHKSAQWRAYQMKYKSQKMEERQASLKNILKECNNEENNTPVCTDGDGKTYKDGEGWLCADGCNRCRCGCSSKHDKCIIAGTQMLCENRPGGGNGSSEWKCEFSPDCKLHPLSPYYGQLTDGLLMTR